MTPDQALAPIKARLEPAMLHAPYKADGERVIQTNNHPDLRPYVFSNKSAPVIANFIANAPTDITRLLAAVEAAMALADERVDTLATTADRLNQGKPPNRFHHLLRCSIAGR